MGLKEDIRSSLFLVLKHPLRRLILRRLSRSPSTYTEILDAVEVESGKLSYHLRCMAGLVSKDDEGRYFLSDLGESALNLIDLEEPTGVSAGGLRATGLRPDFKLLSFFLIAFAVISNVYLAASIQGINRHLENSAGSVFAETQELLDESLATVYAIFEQYEVDRAFWTDLLLYLVQLRSSIMELSSLHPEEIDGIVVSRIESSLTHYIEEFSDVLKSHDSEYLSLTIERRYLVREVHSYLLHLRQSLSSSDKDLPLVFSS